jgi:alpha-ketoglutarate-dependent taurine dioxygenase
MALIFKELSPAIGREVIGLESIKDISTADRANLVAAYNESGLLLFRGFNPSNEDHLALTKIFGAPDIHPIESIRLPDCPEIIQIATSGNHIFALDDPEGDAITGKIDWHSDLTYTVRPGRGALLRAIEIPPEMGQTWFVDIAAVYEALPQDVKDRIENLKVVHSHEATVKITAKAFYGGDSKQSQPSNFPPVIHPLVYAHPVNGKKVLNISPSFAVEIVGAQEQESSALLTWLKDFATQERFIYKHVWQVGDIVLWDNLRTMHYAQGYKKRHYRKMYRTTLKADFVLGTLAT